MYIDFFDVAVEDFEDSAWAGFCESEKLQKLVAYGNVYEISVKHISKSYRKCLRDYLEANNRDFDMQLIDSAPKGMLAGPAPEIRKYLEQTIRFSSESDKEILFSNKGMSSRFKEQLKNLLASDSEVYQLKPVFGDRGDKMDRGLDCEVNDMDFQADHWENFNHREQRCKLMLQGKKLHRMIDAYKQCLMEYMDTGSSCNELLDTLPKAIFGLPEFKNRLKRRIDRASDHERILLLYKLVNLKYGEQRIIQMEDYDLITLFDPENHEGETVEFWPVYYFLKCGLEKDEVRKKNYFIRAHHRFKTVGETALRSWRGQEERQMEAMGLLFPYCNEFDGESFQKFCDARLRVTEDDVKYHCGTKEKTKHVYCYGCRGTRSVLGLDTWEKVFDGYSRRGNRKERNEEIKGCAHVRSLLHDRLYLRKYSIPPEKWTLLEFMDILKIPFYEISGYTGKNRELYINKLASEFNWLFRIKDRLQCRSCHEQMRFDFEYSKKGENVPAGSDLSEKSLFAAYMTTRGHCTHQEEPHDIDVYLNHCIDCHGIIDSRYCTIFDGKHYLCRRCGSGHPENTVPGTICPCCGSNKMKYIGYREFECQNCKHTVKVEYGSFKNHYGKIKEGDLACSNARSNGYFTYRKNCKDVFPVNCDTGIPLAHIIEEPVEIVKSQAVSFDEEVPF